MAAGPKYRNTHFWPILALLHIGQNTPKHPKNTLFYPYNRVKTTLTDTPIQPYTLKYPKIPQNRWFLASFDPHPSDLKPPQKPQKHQKSLF
jgi:hypothetical protein